MYNIIQYEWQIQYFAHLYTYSCQIDKIYAPFVHGFDIALKMPVLCFPTFSEIRDSFTYANSSTNKDRVQI